MGCRDRRYKLRRLQKGCSRCRSRRHVHTLRCAGKLSGLAGSYVLCILLSELLADAKTNDARSDNAAPTSHHCPDEQSLLARQQTNHRNSLSLRTTRGLFPREFSQSANLLMPRSFCPYRMDFAGDFSLRPQIEPHQSLDFPYVKAMDKSPALPKPKL